MPPNPIDLDKNTSRPLARLSRLGVSRGSHHPNLNLIVQGGVPDLRVQD